MRAALALLAAGFGGNRNTTTRMRRYGDGRRELVGEYVDASHLLAPNRDYRVEIAVFDGCTRVRWTAWTGSRTATRIRSRKAISACARHGRARRSAT